jgi:hypothetical protein
MVVVVVFVPEVADMVDSCRLVGSPNPIASIFFV